jgi:hypothetical protein
MDTTVFMSDPACSGIAWRTLGRALSPWQLRVYVPEVVVAEAIAGHQRAIERAQAGLTKWAEDGRRLGYAGLTESALSDLTEAASNYPASLIARLEELDATVMAPPAVDHMVLVGRAAGRRRPCDDKGDGYRDTLNWLTVLALAAQFPDEHLVWVSENSKDFGNAKADELHEDLVEELVVIGAADRVRWVQNLGALVKQLASDHLTGAGANLRDIEGHLKDKSLSQVIQGTLADARGRPLDPRVCGLPIQTVSAELAEVREFSDPELVSTGPGGDGEAVVSFVVTAQVVVSLTLPAGFGSEDPHVVVTSVDASGCRAILAKSLRVEGFITLDKLDRPLGGELSEVVADADDPGREPWKMLTKLSEGQQELLRTLPRGIAPVIPQDLFANLSRAIFPSNVVEQLGRSVLSPATWLAVSRPILPPEYFRQLDRSVLPPEYIQSLGRSFLPPGFPILTGMLWGANLLPTVAAYLEGVLGPGKQRTDGEGEEGDPDRDAPPGAPDEESDED